MALISPSTSRVSIDWASGILVILSPDACLNSMSSSRSATHSMDLCGTPYSCSRMPRHQLAAVSWNDFTPIRRPIRSVGLVMPFFVLMKMNPCRKRRWRKTGNPAKGRP